MSEITAGILSICNLPIMVLILLGTFMGIIVGAILGLSVTMGVALFLPLTFGMDPIAGLSLLCGLYIGGTSGGLISAILLKMPGTAASVATTFDGCFFLWRSDQLYHSDAAGSIYCKICPAVWTI